jgi:hypothetical protein
VQREKVANGSAPAAKDRSCYRAAVEAPRGTQKRPTEFHGTRAARDPLSLSAQPNQEIEMKRLILAGAIALISTAVIAQTPAPKAEPKAKAAAPAAAPSSPIALPGMTCKAQAADKKLAGAAMNSFRRRISRARPKTPT